MLLNVVQEKIRKSLLDCNEIKPVNPKENQPSIFIGKTDAEAIILWPPDAKSQLIGKHPDTGKRLKAKGEEGGEHEMVRQHHLLDGHEFEQTLGNSGGQRSLACYSPRG